MVNMLTVLRCSRFKSLVLALLFFVCVCSQGVGLLSVFALEGLLALCRIAVVRASVALVRP